MSKIGLSILFAGFIFWYGLGFLNTSTVSDEMVTRVAVLILVFFLFMLFGYFIGYNKKVYINAAMPSGSVYVGNRSLLLVILAVITLTCILFASGGKGMLGYHALRAEIAVGILVYIYSMLFTGWRRNLLLAIFLLIVMFSLGIYSRRPFLTLLAPVILIPLIQNKYKLSIKIPIGIFTIVISLIMLLYITGLRYANPYTSPFDLYNLLAEGLIVFLRGEGFDTIHLSAYVMDTYNKTNYLYGGSFFGGVLNFIPRGLWPDKPIAFGITLSSQYYNVGIDSVFTNFGPGIVAEAYANGGYPSVILVALIFGFLVGIADRRIEVFKHDWFYILLACIFYPAVFFIIRGDFLNSFYELYSKTAVVISILIILGLRRRLKAT